MLKHALVAGLFLLVNVAGPALAACTLNTYVPYKELTDLQIEALLGGSEACVPTAGPPWNNQEYHTGNATSPSGNIIDYKLGPAAPGNTDPTTQIGTYNIVSVGLRPSYGVITYTYTGNPSAVFSYEIWGPNASGYYDFCNGPSLVVEANILPSTGGPVACH